MSTWGDKSQAMATLAEALLPLLDRIGDALNDRRKAQPAEAGEDVGNTLRHYLDKHIAASNAVARAVAALNRDALEAEAPAAASIHRAAGRLDAAVDGWIDGLRAMREWDPGSAGGRLPALMAQAFEQPLIETGAWLRNIIDALDDPSGVVERRGLAGEDEVELNLALELTAPESVAEIVSELKRLQGESQVSGTFDGSVDVTIEFDDDASPGDVWEPKPRRFGGLFWGTLLAALGIGWLCGGDD